MRRGEVVQGQRFSLVGFSKVETFLFSASSLFVCRISPGMKVDKALGKVLDTPPKLIHASPSSTTVSSKPSLTSIPKAALLAPGPIPNGKALLSSLDKKQENSTSYKRQKRISGQY